MKNAKRILTFVLAILMMLNMNVGIFAAQATAESQVVSDADEIKEIIFEKLRNAGNKIVGDMNDDGKLNSADALYLLRHTIMPGVYPISAQGDVNGDEKLNSADAIYLLRHTIMPDKYPLHSASCSHIEVIDPAVAPTCQETGLTEGSHCSECDVVIVEQTVLPTIAHNYVNGKCKMCGTPIETQDSEGLEYTLSGDGTYYTVSGIGTCTDVNVVIPATYNGQPVTAIGYQAFYDCANLISIVMPESITSIGNSAFSWCMNLTNIEIPNSVTSIGERAFYECTSLTSIVIPESITSIENYAFYGCERLTSIEMSDSVTSIGYETFAFCTSLTGIELSDSLTSIGSYAFDYCTSLVSIKMSDGMKRIDERAFYWCTSLESIIFNGTKAQWDTISKCDSWDSNAGNYTVCCTDGEITK